MRTQRRSPIDNLKLLDDIARVATGAFGSLGGVRAQIKSMVRQGLEQVMDELELVTRAEFERVEAMAARARDRQEELEARLDALTGKKKPAVKKTAKPAARKGRKK
jgi:BMFP domain-containing protein YqiC